MQGTGHGPLDEMVAYARAKSPYYADVLDGVDRFEDIPPLTEALAKDTLDRLRVPGMPPERIVPAWTAGSSGRPVNFVNDAQAAPAATAARSRLLELAGIPPDVHKVLVLTQPKLTPADVGWTPFAMRSVTRDNLRERLAALDVLPDVVLYGLASFLEWIAAELEPDAGALPMRRPLAVITSGDTLTRIGRARIESAFGCPVHSWYGSTETDPWLAGTPPGEHDRYVINHERAYIEVAGEDGRPCAPGERGVVLVTDLHNRCQPLIRYAVGDVAAMSEDRIDGRPVLERLDGRPGTIVELANGTVITEGGLFVPVVRFREAVAAVREMQGIQTGAMSLELRMVWNDGRDEAVVAQVASACRDLWGEDLEVEVTDVERLELLPSGKRWLLRGLESAVRPT